MRLLLNHLKKFGLVSLFILPFFLFANVVRADAGCSMRNCIHDEGWCEEGAVMSCIEGIQECSNNAWIDCPGCETNSLCDYGAGTGLDGELAAYVASQTSNRMDLFKWYGTGFSTALLADTLVRTAGLPGQNDDGATGQINQGAIVSLAGLMGSMYRHPPASSGEYLAYLKGNLGVSQPAYAEDGVGYQGLEPLIKIWQPFRNVAYLFFIVIFIGVGFAIMFRVKLNPQTVISVQNALPRIVLALILVTFSYAISGLLIDLIYVSTSLLVTILNVEFNIHQNVFGFAADSFGSIYGGEARKVLLEQVSGLIEQIFGGVVGSLFGISINLLGKVIISVAMLFTLVKILFTLITSYVSIIAGTIFSPFILLLEAIPGRNGFSNWLKMMLSNIVVFPVTVAIFALASTIRREVEGGGQLWMAPGIGLGGSTSANVSFIISFGALLATPTVIAKVKEAVSGSRDTGGITGAVGPALQAGGRVISAPTRAFKERLIEPRQMAARKERGDAWVRKKQKSGSWDRGISRWM